MRCDSSVPDYIFLTHIRLERDKVTLKRLKVKFKTLINFVCSVAKWVRAPLSRRLGLRGLRFNPRPRQAVASLDKIFISACRDTNKQ